MLNFPKYNSIVYHNNPLTGRYEKQPSMIAFNKLPFDLKVQMSQKQWLKEQGADQIITGPIQNGKREFFTGLLSIENHCYMGNNYEYVKGVKKLSLIVFIFSHDHKKLNVHYFSRFYIENPNERLKFCLYFINNIL